MKADEYAQRVTPAAPRSRLAPYWTDISKLRDRGYTLEQVCAFLAENGVHISKAGLSKYIKRREEKEGTESRNQPSKAAPVPTNPTSQGTPPARPQETATPEAEAIPDDDLTGMAEAERDRVKRERKAQRFIGDKPANALIKKIQENQK